MEKLNELKQKIFELDKNDICLVDIIRKLLSEEIDILIKVEYENNGYIQFVDESGLDENITKRLTEIDHDELEYFKYNKLEEGVYDINKKLYECRRWYSKGLGKVENSMIIKWINQCLNEEDFYNNDSFYIFTESSKLKKQLSLLHKEDMKKYITLSEFNSWYFHNEFDDGFCYTATDFFENQFKAIDIKKSMLFENKPLSWAHNDMMETQNHEFCIKIKDQFPTFQ